MAAPQPQPAQPTAGGKHFPLTSQSSAPANFSSLQQQMAAPPLGPTGSAGQTATTSPNKGANSATLCRYGQDLVSDINNKVTDIFNTLGSPGLLQLPNYQDKKTKLEEELKVVNTRFKTLRAVYDKVKDTCNEMEQPTDEQLVCKVGEEVESYPITSEMYPYVLEEHRELVEQVRAKNHQLKEIIDQIRSINWEINTMITMRKT